MNHTIHTVVLSAFLLKPSLPDYLEIISSLNLLALFGGLTIWFLDRKKDKDKVLYEEKKQIKKVLFIMLEIRHHLDLPIRTEKISKLYAHVIKNKISSTIGKEAEITDEAVSELVKPILIKMMNELKGDDTSLLEQFNYCVESLSEINPLLSYRLSGKQNIKAYLDSWEDSLKDYHNEYEEKATEEDFNNFLSIVKPHALEAILLDFDEMIKEIASLINKKTKKEIEGVFDSEDDETIKKGMKLEMDYLFDMLEKRFGDSKL